MWSDTVSVRNIIFFFHYRGAELINTNLIKFVEHQKEMEKEVLAGVVQKMERLKMRQQRLHQKTTLFNSDDHYIGEWCELEIRLADPLILCSGLHD